MSTTMNINMAEVAEEVARSLGAEIGTLTAELTAQRHANRMLHERIAELEGSQGTDEPQSSVASEK